MGILNRVLSSLKSSGRERVNVSEQDVAHAERLIGRGIFLEDSGDLEGALRCYEDAISSARQYARAHLNRGNILQIQGHLREALDAYKVALDLQPDYLGAYVNIGNTHMRLAEPTDAIIAYQKALALNAKDVPATAALAAAQETAIRYAEAVDTYRRCLALDSKHVAAQLGLARSLRALEQPEAALEALRKRPSREMATPEACFLEGEILSDLGRHDSAIASFEQTLKIDPLHFHAQTSLGDTQRKLGLHAKAQNSYQRAIQLQPNLPLLRLKLASTLQALGQHNEALLAVERAADLAPESGAIQFNAANLLDELGKPMQAVAHYQRAIAIAPDPQAYNNLGNVLRRLGRSDEALASFSSALQIDSNCAEAHCNIGLEMRARGSYAQALQSMQTACELNPSSAVFQCNLATVLLDLNRLQEAQTCCQRAQELDPAMPEAHNNAGTVFLEQGMFREAAASFERALQLAPDYAAARQNLGHAQLGLGNLAEGWPNYEYRIYEHRDSREPSPLPQWTGQPVRPDDRILIFVEQGLGDMLQFARYLPMVAKRFPAGVGFYVVPPLATLFRRSFLMVTVLDKVPSDQNQWQWQCPLLSLPLAFGTVLQTIPRHVPYLIPDEDRRANWATRIETVLQARGGHRKIGLVWKPGKGMKNIANLKAATLNTLSPLLDLGGCTWFSLQKESDPEKEVYVSSGKLIDWSDDFQDFDDTAALAANMDLVISVDTSVAHLAGGLGIPTWLLNRYASDWRWMRGREDSPWYPTFRIFAQEAPGDWEGVAQRLAQALASWLSAGNASSWRCKGNAVLLAGDFVAAQHCYENGIQVDPTDAACHANLGFVLMQQGKRREARRPLSQAVALDPEDADALYMLGNLSRNEGELTQAVAYLHSALQVKPDFDHCRRELCLVLVQAGQLGEAKEVMRSCVISVYGSKDDLVFRGTMHLAFGEYVDAEIAYLAASRIEPLGADDLINLGAAQLGQRNAIAAASTYQKVLDADPNNVMARYNQATAFQLYGDVDQAIDGFRHALSLDPENAHAHQNLLGALTLSTSCSPADYLKEAHLFGERVASKATPFTSWLCNLRPLGGRTLRIGLVSGDLRQHPVGYFLLAVLKHIDPAVISCIAYSNAAVEDAFSEQLKPHFSAWHPTLSLSDLELAQKIHADAIDVLVDLAGHTAHNRLPVFAWRPAPVQVTWLGYWASTGMAEVDYILADAVTLPQSDANSYTETAWYLPSTRLCFTPPDSDVQPSSPPVARNGFITFGSFQKLDKVSDTTLSAWATVLNELPTARLRLQSRPLGFHDAAEHMLQRMQRVGMDVSRVDLLGGAARDKYLRAYNEIDIVLDTFPFPGGTTTAEALWMGVPTITLSGDTLIARQGESMMRCVGLSEWVAYSQADYVRIAVDMAADTATLTQLRLRLRDLARQSPLYDAVLFAHHLTLALRAMALKHRVVGDD